MCYPFLVTERENANGQEEADITGSQPYRRAEEITGAQGGEQDGQ